ncbi:DNA-binding protein [Echinicola pacifica]|uniref:DNA-binding protein n=1 Tax=Echinicola pacifica TaxID=346377 RepID=A0A918Q8P2_9BACT|nr:DUF177 domain-containing protein [Echinicola pacifica]GGZ36987.1 DNA-binding protein [Echinicola pacifica]
MKFWRAFDIEIIKLNEGKHEFTFEINDDFFSHFEDNDLVKQGNLEVKVLIKKGSNLLEVIYQIKGQVELTCDRSLEKYDEQIESSQKVLYKYGSEEAEINEEMFMITQDTPSINVAQLIYEFILLSLPAKKIHPSYRDDEDEAESEGKMIYWSDSENEDNDDLSEEEEDQQVDPRWEALKKIKKKD